MIPIVPEQAGALKRLVGTSDFQIFLRMLEDNLTDQDRANRYELSDVQLRINQGVTQALDEILSVCADARNIVERMQNSR